MRQVPDGVPDATAALLQRIAELEDAELLAMGEEFKRAWPTRDTTDVMSEWLKEPSRRAWFLLLGPWVTSFVEDRFPNGWGAEDPQKYIRPAIEAAAVAAVMYAADELPVPAYKDACRGFHAAYL